MSSQPFVIEVSGLDRYIVTFHKTTEAGIVAFGESRNFRNGCPFGIFPADCENLCLVSKHRLHSVVSVYRYRTPILILMSHTYLNAVLTDVVIYIFHT